jgi:hypothetical protein
LEKTKAAFTNRMDKWVRGGRGQFEMELTQVPDTSGDETRPNKCLAMNVVPLSPQ